MNQLMPATFRVLDRLGNTMGPVVVGLGEMLDMHVTLVVGGPEPKKNGQLNVITYVMFMFFLRSLCGRFWYSTL